MSEAVKIEIRRAAPRDFVNVMRLLEQAVQENEVAYPAIDNMKLIQWIVDTKREGEILVADLSGRIVGVLGMTTQEWKWSSDKFIHNEFFFVLPQFRSHGTADFLLKAAETFSDNSGLRLIIGFSGGKQAALKDRMMGLKGYLYAGGTFTRLPTPK